MTFDTLLAPTDGTNPAAAAAARRFELAAQLDATVHGLSSANCGHETSSTRVGDSLRVHHQQHAAAPAGENE